MAELAERPHIGLSRIPLTRLDRRRASASRCCSALSLSLSSCPLGPRNCTKTAKLTRGQVAYTRLSDSGITTQASAPSLKRANSYNKGTAHAREETTRSGPRCSGCEGVSEVCSIVKPILQVGSIFSFACLATTYLDEAFRADGLGTAGRRVERGICETADRTLFKLQDLPCLVPRTSAAQ
jgi:hypothetical protein